MGKKIWIDAGHGGTDPGALGSGGRTEKADNLRLALLLDAAFRRQGCETVLTRTGDKSLTLEARTKLERDNKCDLAIACHRNAATATARGLEIWLHTAAPQSYKDWAGEMAEEIAALGLPLRESIIPQKVGPGVFRGFRTGVEENYYANSGTNAPSMLMELGFITSDADNRFFDGNLPAVAEAIVRASCRFLNLAYQAPAPIKPTPKPEVDYKAQLLELVGPGVDLGEDLPPGAMDGRARFEGLLRELEGLLKRYSA